MSGLPMNSTASAISDQLAGGLVRCSHLPSKAIRHFWGLPCSRSAIVFNSPSGTSKNVPIGRHSLATVGYSSLINCFIVGTPAEQTIYSIYIPNSKGSHYTTIVTVISKTLLLACIICVHIIPVNCHLVVAGMAAVGVYGMVSLSRM